MVRLISEVGIVRETEDGYEDVDESGEDRIILVLRKIIIS